MSDVETEKGPDVDGAKRWHLVATCIGYNELAKMAKTLGEKVYFRLIRDATEERLIEHGGQRLFKGPDEIIVEISVPDHMPYIRLSDADIELMREAVAAYDARKTADPK